MTNLHRSLRSVVAAGLLVWTASVAGAASTVLDGAVLDAAGGATMPSRGTLSKIINLNGERVQVSVDVGQIQFILVPHGPPRLNTSIQVTVGPADGGALTNTISARRVTLERVRPPRRVERLPLQQILTLVPDPTGATYYATRLPEFARNALLKVTVRLETADETRFVRMGNLRVRGATVNFPGPIPQPYTPILLPNDQ